MCVLFHKPHMDPLDSLHVCSFPQTTHGSTSGHCMCVLSTDHMWTHQSHCMCVILKLALESLHVCSIHKPHMDPPLSLHVCSFHKPHMDQQVGIACVFIPQTT